MYTNARGIRGKKPSLTEITQNLKPHIVTICETQLKSEGGFEIEGYMMFGKTRKQKNGGGVAILIRDDMKRYIAPHISESELEILWVSMRRKLSCPLYIGVYYGKQESRSNKEEIEEEFFLLSNEIKQIEKDGEVILTMDGNAHIGIMGEEISRNGKLLKQLCSDNELGIMNISKKCEGKVTRQSSIKENEKSAIDFVLATELAEEWIEKMIIDEQGEFRLMGKNPTDHNSIFIKLKVPNFDDQCSDEKGARWNLAAPEEKWTSFRKNIDNSQVEMGSIMRNKNLTISQRYEKWEKEIDKAAYKSIGKTSYKKKQVKESSELRKLRQERRVAKNEYEARLGKCDEERIKQQKQDYINKQKAVIAQVEQEMKESTEKKFIEIIEEGKANGRKKFWNEKERQNKIEVNKWLITKDKDGRRLFTPMENKDNIAKYYEELYRNDDIKWHPYHDELHSKIQMNLSDMEYEEEQMNMAPSLKEIENAIATKKNGKVTTDYRNEMLKKGGKPMAEAVKIVTDVIWEEETIPEKWNEGIISSIWKNKGDREVLKNMRGITVSSAIGTIPEHIINERILKQISFSQAQGGGQPGKSTCDHVFIVRGLLKYGKSRKKNLFITFFDVSKAYDHADVTDMMQAIWEDGVRGKLWRIALKLNQNLTSKINTRYGLTRKIERKAGGKQGGKTTTTLFAKIMDTLQQDLSGENNNREILGVVINDLEINSLLWVDDVMTCTEGENNQEKVLRKVNNFAEEHKMTWGKEKCKVMQLKGKKPVRETWKLGELDIENCDSYPYLGDIISKNSTNKDNLDNREKKMKNGIATLFSITQSDVLQYMEMKVLLELYEVITIPGLLFNCESWELTKSDFERIEQMQYWALKKILGVPMTTPSAAVIYSTGVLLIETRIKMRQLQFLHKILRRNGGDWTKHIMCMLIELELGWGKSIKNHLHEFEIEYPMETITKIPQSQWNRIVKEKAEIYNEKRLSEMCKIKKDGVDTIKRKTSYILDKLKEKRGRNSMRNRMGEMPRMKVRALVMGQSQMLQCANNYKAAYLDNQCIECKVVDDEQHRISECKLWKEINLFGNEERINFSDIYNEETESLMRIVDVILKIWNLKNGKNEMSSLVT